MMRHTYVLEKNETTDTEAIKNAVIQGMGLAVLSSMSVEEEIKEGTQKKISLKEINTFRDILFVCHKNKFMSEFLKCFLESI